MKIVINKAWGGFEVPEELEEELCPLGYYTDDLRTNPKLIAWVETHPKRSSLHIFSIPNNATDWRILDYDGKETVIYVVDGKLY